MTDPLPIFLLTDFGTSDTYVGQVKAVLSARAPGAPLVDLTHEVSPYAIDEGAWLLETALPYLPSPAVLLAVVDPGVGSERLPIAVRAASGGDSVRYFVGPDNGLLSPVVPLGTRPSRPGPCPAPKGVEVRTIESPEVRLETVSATFHGRDLFAPAAARIAVTGDHESLGAPRNGLTLLPPFSGTPEGPNLRGTVIHVDRYGNLVTTIRKEQLPPDFTLDINGQRVEHVVRTFSDAPPGALACHIDSSGFLAIAEREGNAAARAGAGRGDAVLLALR